MIGDPQPPTVCAGGRRNLASSAWVGAGHATTFTELRCFGSDVAGPANATTRSQLCLVLVSQRSLLARPPTACAIERYRIAGTGRRSTYFELSKSVEGVHWDPTFSTFRCTGRGSQPRASVNGPGARNHRGMWPVAWRSFFLVGVTRLRWPAPDVKRSFPTHVLCEPEVELPRHAMERPPAVLSDVPSLLRHQATSRAVAANRYAL
jgi:hypothetical protein